MNKPRRRLAGIAAGAVSHGEPAGAVVGDRCSHRLLCGACVAARGGAAGGANGGRGGGGGGGGLDGGSGEGGGPEGGGPEGGGLEGGGPEGASAVMMRPAKTSQRSPLFPRPAWRGGNAKATGDGVRSPRHRWAGRGAIGCPRETSRLAEAATSAARLGHHIGTGNTPRGETAEPETRFAPLPLRVMTPDVESRSRSQRHCFQEHANRWYRSVAQNARRVVQRERPRRAVPGRGTRERISVREACG
jgi:hypothetical protein